MSCSAFDFFQFIGEFLLKNLILVCFEILKTLILLEHVNVISEFINESRSPVLDDVVCCNHDIERFSCLVEVILEGFYPFENSF